VPPTTTRMLGCTPVHIRSNHTHPLG